MTSLFLGPAHIKYRAGVSCQTAGPIIRCTAVAYGQTHVTPQPSQPPQLPEPNHNHHNHHHHHHKPTPTHHQGTTRAPSSIARTTRTTRTTTTTTTTTATSTTSTTTWCLSPSVPFSLRDFYEWTPSGQPVTGAAQRRREQRLRVALRHQQQSIAQAATVATHHSDLRRQKTATAESTNDALRSLDRALLAVRR